ncbi:MAG: hypothetical protein ACR2I8_09850 [Steroidobacteraceae bacterium]
MAGLATGPAYPHDARMALMAGRDRDWLIAALAFGVLVLPFLVHLTGTMVLGGYAGGGALGFFGDFVRGLVTLRWYSWSIALGPLAVVVAWRTFRRVATA